MWDRNPDRRDRATHQVASPRYQVFREGPLRWPLGRKAQEAHVADVGNLQRRTTEWALRPFFFGDSADPDHA